MPTKTVLLFQEFGVFKKKKKRHLGPSNWNITRCWKIAKWEVQYWHICILWTNGGGGPDGEAEHDLVWLPLWLPHSCIMGKPLTTQGHKGPRSLFLPSAPGSVWDSLCSVSPYLPSLWGDLARPWADPVIISNKTLAPSRCTEAMRAFGRAEWGEGWQRSESSHQQTSSVVQRQGRRKRGGKKCVLVLPSLKRWV